jgi:hypothetical protein
MKRMELVMFATLAILLAGAARGAEHAVAPLAAGASDDNPGTAEKPFKTLAKALAAAKGGDTVLLGSGEYPAVSITATYDPPLALRAAKGERPAFVGGLSVAKGGGVRVAGVVFTWTKAAGPRTG